MTVQWYEEEWQRAQMVVLSLASRRCREDVLSSTLHRWRILSMQFSQYGAKMSLSQRHIGFRKASLGSKLFSLIDEGLARERAAMI